MGILNKIKNWLEGVNQAPFEVNNKSIVNCPEKIIFKGNIPKGIKDSRGCFIQAKNGIVFGNNILLAKNVGIISANHNKDDYSKYDKTTPIEIGNNVWIGFGAIILPGVKLGKNVIVGAGSVVTKSFPDNVVVAGNPAKIIKIRK